MSLLFSTLSRFVIAFLPRSKHLLISWLKSPSAGILEPKKIKSGCYNSETRPQRNGNKLTLELKLTVPKTTKMVLVRPPMINFKMAVRADHAVSACSPLQSIKLFPPDCQGSDRGVGLWTVTCPPHQLPASRIKHFPFHQPGLLTDFWVLNSRTPLSHPWWELPLSFRLLTSLVRPSSPISLSLFFFFFFFRKLASRELDSIFLLLHWTSWLMSPCLRLEGFPTEGHFSAVRLAQVLGRLPARLPLYHNTASWCIFSLI